MQITEEHIRGTDHAVPVRGTGDGWGLVYHPSAPLDEGLSTLWGRTQMGRCDNNIAKKQPSLVFSLSCCLSSYSAQWMQDPIVLRKREYP